MSAHGWLLRSLAPVACVLLGIWMVTRVVETAAPDNWVSAREVGAARTALMGLATYEEMRGTSEALLDEIRKALDADVGTVDWSHDSVRRGVSGCEPAEREIRGAFSEGTRSRGVMPTHSDHSDHSDHTDRVLEIIEAVAGRHGYKPATRFVDGVGDQYFYLSTDRGGRISVVFGERLDIRVTSDCYLTEAAMDEPTQ